MKRTMERRHLPPIALIGCGAAAQEFFLPVLKRYANYREAVVLVDAAPDRAAVLARELGVRHHSTDYRQLPREISAAIVATPHHLHAEPTLHFLRHGVPVFVEKPMGTTAIEAQRMLAAADQSKTILMVNHYRRLFPAYQAVCQLIGDRRLGNVCKIAIHDGTKFAWKSLSAFYVRDPAARGVLLDRGAHTIDIICWWLNAVPTLTAAYVDRLGGIDGLVDVALKHGATDIQLKFGRYYRLENYYRVQCERGEIHGRLFDVARFHITQNGNTRTQDVSSPLPHREYGWQLTENFLDVARGIAPPLFQAHDVAPSLSVIDAAYQHAKTFAMPWYDADPTIAAMRADATCHGKGSVE